MYSCCSSDLLQDHHEEGTDHYCYESQESVQSKHVALRVANLGCTKGMVLKELRGVKDSHGFPLPGILRHTNFEARLWLWPDLAQSWQVEECWRYKNGVQYCSMGGYTSLKRSKAAKSSSRLKVLLQSCIAIIYCNYRNLMKSLPFFNMFLNILLKFFRCPATISNQHS